MSYELGKTLYKLCALANGDLTATGTKYTWTPAKRWTVRGMVFVPTTAIGACTTAAIIDLNHTPSGGSAASKITATITAGTGVGTEIAGTATSTGTDYFDVASGDTVHIATDTAMAGGTTSGVGDVYLIISELPA